MADTRINALSTATVSLSDDFLPIDGTTAGTRKLSAYSPSFGGNATVGGTLTVNGTTASVGAGTGSIISKLNGAAGSYKLSIYQSAGVDRWYAGLAAGAESGSDGGAPYSIVALTDAGAVIDNALLITRAAGGSITTPRPVSISATTASTSTSSGALVVGNGTSGGLGVGGAIWGGGKVHVGSAGYADGGAKLNVYATPSDAGYLYGIRLSDNSTATLALGLQTPTGTTSSFIHSNIALGFGTVGVAALNINTSQQVQVLATTASSSTTTGALVVSGGVGVAGAIYAGGDVVSTGSGAQEIVCESTTAGNYAGVISKNNSGNTFNLYSLGSTYGGTVFGGVSGNNQAVLEGSASISSICISHANPTGKIIIAPNRTNVLMVENSLVTVASGVDLKLGNAYAAGAPTATGYIVIKDSTGTSYKIPAVAL